MVLLRRLHACAPVPGVPVFELLHSIKPSAGDPPKQNSHAEVGGMLLGVFSDYAAGPNPSPSR